LGAYGGRSGAVAGLRLSAAVRGAVDLLVGEIAYEDCCGGEVDHQALL
jgi:hypothetical protein